MKNIILIHLFILTFSVFPKAQDTYKLTESDSYASCTDYVIVDQKNTKINLPANVQKSLECPLIADIHNTILTFKEGLGIKLYNLDKKVEKTLFQTYEDIDGISNPVWSPDNRKIMFVTINQKQNHEYTSFCRIIVLTLDQDGNVTEKKKFDKPVNFGCGNICTSTPGEDFMFVDNETIKYKRHSTLVEKPGSYEIIKLNN